MNMTQYNCRFSSPCSNFLEKLILLILNQVTGKISVVKGLLIHAHNVESKWNFYFRQAIDFHFEIAGNI